MNHPNNTCAQSSIFICAPAGGGAQLTASSDVLKQAVFRCAVFEARELSDSHLLKHQAYFLIFDFCDFVARLVSVSPGPLKQFIRLGPGCRLLGAELLKLGFYRRRGLEVRAG